jgi:threonine/homoserine/homoserine lactone efflux protein
MRNPIRPWAWGVALFTLIAVALALATTLAQLRLLLGLISVTGAAFVLYLAWESFGPLRHMVNTAAAHPRSWSKGIIT